MPCTIITGGAGGIGAAVAQKLLESDPDTRCAITDIQAGNALQIRSAFGDERVCFVECDVTDRGAVADAAERIADWCDGDVAGLVAAAGVAAERASADVSPEQWHRVLDVHLDGTLFWCQAALRPMEARGGGAMVVLSSAVARVAHPRRLAYSCAKAAIEQLARTLAVEWAEKGIRVNAVAPGYVDTEMVRALVREGTFDADTVAGMHALRRMADVGEIADGIAYLLSEQASFVTGAVLTIDGGFSAVKTMWRGDADAPVSASSGTVG